MVLVKKFSLETPRDRAGKASLVKKNQTKLSDEIDRKILSMFSFQIPDLYGLELSEASLTAVNQLIPQLKNGSNAV